MSCGSLNWLLTIPADGSLPIDGVAPTLIEWHTKCTRRTFLRTAIAPGSGSMAFNRKASSCKPAGEAHRL